MRILSDQEIQALIRVREVCRREMDRIMKIMDEYPEIETFSETKDFLEKKIIDAESSLSDHGIALIEKDNGQIGFTRLR